MFRFDYSFYREENEPRFILCFDIYKVEDHWRQRYLFSHPKYELNEMERHRINNENRCQWLRFDLKLCSLTVFIDIKLKKVGNIVNGRLIDEEASVKRWKELKEKRNTIKWER